MFNVMVYDDKDNKYLKLRSQVTRRYLRDSAADARLVGRGAE